MKTKLFKRVLMIALITPFFINVAQSANDIRHVQKKIWREMIYVLQQPCVQSGDECYEMVNILILNPFSITQASQGRMIEVQIDEAASDFTPLDGFTDPYSTQSDGKLYTFPEGTELRIDDCDSDPSLIGLTLDVGGMTTDQNGVLHYYLPF